MPAMSSATRCTLQTNRVLFFSYTDYNIHHDRFLNLNMNNVNDLLQNTNISTLEKQRLVFSIQKLKAEDQVSITLSQD